MTKVDDRVKVCHICEKEITLREALEVVAAVDDIDLIVKLQDVCSDDTEREDTKITELDVIDDDDHILDNVFYPMSIACVFTPVVCKECLNKKEVK